MRTFPSLIVAVLFVLCTIAGAEEQVSPRCADGFSEKDCQLALGIFKTAFGQLNVSITDWRWVIVPSHRWEQVARDFGIKGSTPAFSSLTARSTYISSVLVFPRLGVDENLQRYTKLEGLDRLRWVIAHESGHIVCDTYDDRLAEDAAKRITHGSRKHVCGAIRARPSSRRGIRSAD